MELNDYEKGEILRKNIITIQKYMSTKIKDNTYKYTSTEEEFGKLVVKHIAHINSN